MEDAAAEALYSDESVSANEPGADATAEDHKDLKPAPPAAPTDAEWTDTAVAAVTPVTDIDIEGLYYDDDGSSSEFKSIGGSDDDLNDEYSDTDAVIDYYFPHGNKVVGDYPEEMSNGGPNDDSSNEPNIDWFEENGATIAPAANATPEEVGLPTTATAHSAEAAMFNHAAEAGEKEPKSGPGVFHVVLVLGVILIVMVVYYGRENGHQHQQPKLQEVQQTAVPIQPAGSML
jgi:hypothetical protein